MSRRCWWPLALAVLLALQAGCGGPRGSTPFIYYHGSPWVEGSINGSQGLFLLDTGASASVVDSELAERAGVRATGGENVTATTGSVLVQTGRADFLELAGRTHTDRMVLLQDLGPFRAPGGRRKSGLVGSDFLLEYTLSIDMRRSRLWLNRHPAPSQNGMKPHRMQLSSGVPTIQVFFGDDLNRPVWAKLDTGSSYADERIVHIEITPDRARSLLGEDYRSRPSGRLRVISLAGEEELLIFRYGPVRLLGREFESVRLIVHEHEQGAFANPEAVLVSGSLLRQFDRVDLDFPRRTVWVK